VIYRLELVLDERGVRCIPLRSLASALEAAADEATGQDHSYEARAILLLLDAVLAAEEAPLPGLTPVRADAWRTAPAIPGMELAEPVADPELGPVHPGAV
jgi:hypothetical protein